MKDAIASVFRFLLGEIGRFEPWSGRRSHPSRKVPFLAWQACFEMRDEQGQCFEVGGCTRLPPRCWQGLPRRPQAGWDQMLPSRFVSDSGNLEHVNNTCCRCCCCCCCCCSLSSLVCGHVIRRKVDAAPGRLHQEKPSMLPLLPSNMQAWLGNLERHASGFLSNLLVPALEIVLSRKQSDIVGLSGDAGCISDSTHRTMLCCRDFFRFPISVVPIMVVIASRGALIIRCCDFTKVVALREL